MLSTEDTKATAEKRLEDEPAAAVIDYGRVLRAIGQDLADLFPKSLEIETDRAGFVVRGQSHPNPFQNYRRLGYKKVWRQLLGKRSERELTSLQAAAVAFERSYAPEDIDKIDKLYRADRTGETGRPDSYSLAERLRVMGGIVESRKGRFKCLRKNGDSLVVEYWDQSGEIQSAKLTTIIMYRNPDAPPLHSTTPRELWEGYDF